MQPIFFPVVALVALIGVRLLGIRLGWWQALLVAWLGLATAGFALTAVGDQDFHGGGLALVISLGLLRRSCSPSTPRTPRGSATPCGTLPSPNAAPTRRCWNGR
jgi:hypothetical protein